MLPGASDTNSLWSGVPRNLRRALFGSHNRACSPARVARVYVGACHPAALMGVGRTCPAGRGNSAYAMDWVNDVRPDEIRMADDRRSAKSTAQDAADPDVRDLLGGRV